MQSAKSLLPRLIYTFYLSLIFLVLYIVFSNIFFNSQERLRFERFDIVQELQADGYSDYVFIRKVIDKMYQIQSDTSKYATLYNTAELTQELDSFDMDIPGAGISLSKLITIIEKFVGFKPNRISGEVIKLDGKENYAFNLNPDKSPEQKVANTGIEKAFSLLAGEVVQSTIDKKYKLTIRSKRTIAESYVGGDVDELIAKAAEYVLRNIEPVTLGLYYDVYDKEDELKELINFTETKYSRKDALAVSTLLKSFYHFRKNDIEKTMFYAHKARSLSPENLYALDNLAYISQKREQHGKALKYLLEIEKLAEKEYVQTYTDIAESYLVLEDYDAAFSYVKKSLSMAPNDAYVNLFAAVYELNKNQLESSEMHFGLAKELDTEITEEYFYRHHYPKLLVKLASKRDYKSSLK